MTVRVLRTRWRLVTIGARCWCWRAGLQRREWWIGVRYDYPADVWTIGVFGLVVVIGRKW